MLTYQRLKVWFMLTARSFGCVSVWWVGIVGIVGEGKGRMGAASFPIFPHINHTKCSFDRKYHAGEG